jgi:prepilin-type N-terminal cleavage/methylation domain-containing protein
MKRRQTNNSGFTLIELMLATLLFSIVLVVIVAAFLQIGRLFYKGVSVNTTNEAARIIGDNVSDDIKFSRFANCVPPDTDPNPPTSDLTKSHNCRWQGFNGSANTYYFCVGSHRYTYTLFHKVTVDEYNDHTSLSGLQQVRINSGGCPAPDYSQDSSTLEGTSPTQLLAPDMQLNNLYFTCNGYRCHLVLHIIYYGADDQVFYSPASPTDLPTQALSDYDATCSGNLLSSQFCSTADLDETILLRN